MLSLVLLSWTDSKGNGIFSNVRRYAEISFQELWSDLAIVNYKTLKFPHTAIFK